MSLTVSVQDLISEASNPLLGIHPSWERVCLRDVATVLNGFAFPSKNFERAAGTPLIRIRDVGSASTECRYKGAFDKRYLVRAGDLIVGMDGDFRCARWQGTDALLNQRVCRVDVTSKQYLSEFLEIVLPAYLDAIRAATSSVTVAHLSSKSISEIPLPLPPLAEQKRIVGKVKEVLGRGNAARGHLARVPAILKRFRQAVLAAACEGRLTASDTAAWTETTLGEASREITVGHVGPMADEYVDRGIPFLRSQNVREFRFDPKGLKFVSKEFHLRLRKTILRPGDIAVVRSGNSGVACVVPRELKEANCADLVVIRPSERLNSAFAAIFLNSSASRAHVDDVKVGIAQGHFNIGSAREMPIRLPSLAEQREIGDRVDALFKLADAMEKRVATATARAEKLTQAILAKALRGELVPTEAGLARRASL